MDLFAILISLVGIKTIPIVNFNLDKSIELLERTPKIFKALFYGLSHDWATNSILFEDIHFN